MENLRALFENEYPGKKVLFESLIKQIFVKANDTTLTDEQELSDSDKKQIKSFSIIAQVRGSFPITFADIELQDNVALKRSRVNIQNCVRKVMENDSNALIFFHFTDNAKEWRVSYVNKADSLKNSTSAKRYTYLCGPEHSCRTIAERFSTLEGLSTIKDENMLEAFAVAPLSDDFFNEYRKHYADLVEYISGKRFIKKGGKFVEEKTKKAASEFANAFNGDDKTVRDFVKKMMGRLVFLQFLQKKGWLGVPKNAKWGTGDKNFIYNLFTNADVSVKNDFLEQALEPLFFKSLNCDRGEEAIAPKAVCSIYGSEIRIPYLNGGLFEEDELDKKRVKFKKEHFESIFEFFNQYNFTIDETDTDDIEIGVDPEMLGKIFENLLEDNKDKGAFYTPKEIVQYMCRESLIAYLETETVKHDETASKDKIRNFVLNHEASSFSEKEKADILKALIDVKICDPAVGSGAFPMGMLNELLPCVQILTGEAKTRSELKKHIVKNNIYGVDIEKGAVDIARLRFWLAIIVDEEEPLPLPNLDYKIMQGNSLLESFEGEDLSNMTKQESGNLFDNGEAIAKLTQAINGFYIPHDHVAKAKIRAQIKENIIQLLKERQLPPKVIEDLTKLDLHENSQFFLWHTWFYDVFNRPSNCNGRNGFDIVIGNPPYVVYEGNHKGELDSIKKQAEFKIALGGKLNAYKLFLAKAINTLTSKNGIITLIFQNSFLADKQAENLRKYIFSNSEFITIDSFPERDNKKKRVFESAKMSVCIVFIRNCFSDSLFYINFWNDKDKTSGICTAFTPNDIKMIDSSSMTIPRIKKEFKELIIKIKNLKEVIKVKCYQGELNMTVHRPYFTMDSSFPKVLKGASIQRYFYTEDMSQGVVEYVNEKKYLKDFKKSEKAYHHESERIAMQGMTGANDKIRLVSTILPSNIYLAHSCNYILSDKSYNLKYILGILNSKILNWYFRCFSTNSNVNSYEVEQLPIPSATPAQQQEIIVLVDKILAAKKDCRIKHGNDSELADTSTLEMQIDALVYKLYGLTDEEIKIIEQT
mgnify:CR=1 FL=1